MNKIKIFFPLVPVFLRQGRGGFGLKSVESDHPVFIDLIYQMVEGVNYVKSQVSVKGLIVTLMLSLMILMSAIGVVHSSHLSRQLFAEQSLLLDRNDQLQLEWAQLLLEQSAWSSPDRLESVATSELNMKIPEAKDINLVY